MVHAPKHFLVIFMTAWAFVCAPVSATDIELPPPVAKLLAADAECIDRHANPIMDARETAQLSENHRLYLVPCFTGAYNVVYRIYVFDRRYPNEAKLSVFAAFSDQMGWYGKIQLINAEYDPKTQTLTAFEKGRGLGDCGSVPTYRWNEYDWRMISYRYWGKCDGSRMPGDWPVIYRFKEPKTPQ